MIPWLLLAAALADAPPELRDEVVSVDITETEVVSFGLPACERIRALFLDDKPDVTPRSRKLVITLENQSDQMCLYRGVSMSGFLKGTLVTSPPTPEGTGLFIAPGKRLSFRIEIDDPTQKRGGIELQIPPDERLIVLKGLTPEEAPMRAEAKRRANRGLAE